ncbi:MAG: PEP-CTERM sorting domain-containing protein [Planctomycetes bacterium]|nr:PEP-CTERM sorting domain-containing protein [Planctomycetota bacterium]
MILAVAVLVWTAPIASAQQVTVFSETFESYTVGSSLLPQGSAKWASATAEGKTTVRLNAAATNRYLYFNGGNEQATTVVLGAARATATLTFNLRYTGNDGDGTQNEIVTDGQTFQEFESGDDVSVQYTVNGTSFTNLQTFTWNSTTYRAGFVAVTIHLPSPALKNTLQIRFQQPAGGTNRDQWAIDNVVLMVAVPEPATWALFALGICGLGFEVRRRRAARRARTTV